KKQRIRSHSSLEEMVDLEDNAVARQVEDPRPGPEWAIERGERAQIVQHAVLQLPQNQRLMIALYHFQHRTYEEIAEIMGLPMGRVKSRLKRAKRALKKNLDSMRELLES